MLALSLPHFTWTKLYSCKETRWTFIPLQHLHPLERYVAGAPLIISSLEDRESKCSSCYRTHFVLGPGMMDFLGDYKVFGGVSGKLAAIREQASEIKWLTFKVCYRSSDFSSTPASLRGERCNAFSLFLRNHSASWWTLFQSVLISGKFILFQLQMVSSNTNSMEAVRSHLLFFSGWRSSFFEHTWNMFSQAIAFLRFSYPTLSLSLTFINCQFHPLKHEHTTRMGNKSFVLISEEKSGGGWNFAARVQCQKLFICVFRETEREEAAHVPSWWLSDFLVYFLLFISEQLLGGKKRIHCVDA